MQQMPKDGGRLQDVRKDPGREERDHTTPEQRRDARRARPKPGQPKDDPFIRAEREDDDGYDPYSDRRPKPEPLFERDPWG